MLKKKIYFFVGIFVVLFLGYFFVTNFQNRAITGKTVYEAPSILNEYLDFWDCEHDGYFWWNDLCHTEPELIYSINPYFKKDLKKLLEQNSEEFPSYPEDSFAWSYRDFFTYPPISKKITPFRRIFSLKDGSYYGTTKIYLFDFDISSLINIKNEEDIKLRRRVLIEYIWKGKGLPQGIPNKIEKNIKDDICKNCGNLKQTDNLIIKMDYGVNSIGYIFHPVKSNNKLMIYHQGHSLERFPAYDDLESIKFLLENGYTVLGFAMPLHGGNNQPEINGVRFVDHSNFSLIENKNFSSLKFFLEPIYVSLNYIEKNYDFDSISMMGLSGGGWTTTFYSAIDKRIDKSYPIAGSLPLMFISSRDYEQTIPDAYGLITNYLSLYIMGSHKRKQIQILNKKDTCCFQGDIYTLFPYEKDVQNVLLNLGGKFEVYIDDNDKHSITKNTLNKILKEELTPNTIKGL